MEQQVPLSLIQKISSLGGYKEKHNGVWTSITPEMMARLGNFIEGENDDSAYMNSDFIDYSNAKTFSEDCPSNIIFLGSDVDAIRQKQMINPPQQQRQRHKYIVESSNWHSESFSSRLKAQTGVFYILYSSCVNGNHWIASVSRIDSAIGKVSCFVGDSLLGEADATAHQMLKYNLVCERVVYILALFSESQKPFDSKVYITVCMKQITMVDCGLETAFNQRNFVCSNMWTVQSTTPNFDADAFKTTLQNIWNCRDGREDVQSLKIFAFSFLKNSIELLKKPLSCWDAAEILYKSDKTPKLELLQSLRGEKWDAVDIIEILDEKTPNLGLKWLIRVLMQFKHRTTCLSEEESFFEISSDDYVLDIFQDIEKSLKGCFGQHNVSDASDITFENMWIAVLEKEDKIKHLKYWIPGISLCLNIRINLLDDGNCVIFKPKEDLESTGTVFIKREWVNELKGGNYVYWESTQEEFWSGKSSISPSILAQGPFSDQGSTSFLDDINSDVNSDGNGFLTTFGSSSVHGFLDVSVSRSNINTPVENIYADALPVEQRSEETHVEEENGNLDDEEMILEVDVAAKFAETFEKVVKKGIFLTKDAVKNAVYDLFKNTCIAFPKVVESSKKVLKFICQNSKTCKWVVRAGLSGEKNSKSKYGKRVWIVSNSAKGFNLKHYGLGCEEISAKKGKPLAQLLENTSDQPLLNLCDRSPTNKNIKSLQTFLDDTYNHEYSTSAVRTVLWNNSPKRPLGHLRQYTKIENLLDVLKDHDPAGLYDLETDCGVEMMSKIFVKCGMDPVDNPCSRKFKRFCFANSGAKNFWKHSVSLTAIDAAHLQGILGGQMFLFVQADANLQLVLLFAGIASVENADNWLYFYNRFRESFPGKINTISDKHKGLDKLENTIKDNPDIYGEFGSEVMHSNCARHKLVNYSVLPTTSGIMGTEYENVFFAMCKSTYSFLTNTLLGELTKLSAPSEDFWTEEVLQKLNAEKLLTCHETPWWRRGRICSNDVEEENSAFAPYRALGVVDFTINVLLYSEGKFDERRALGLKLLREGILVTPAATKSVNKFLTAHKENNWGALGQGLDMSMADGDLQTPPGRRIIKGSLREATGVNIKRCTIELEIVIENEEKRGLITCGICNDSLEMQHACGHASIFGLLLQKYPSGLKKNDRREDWFLKSNSTWFGKCWSTETYIKQYEKGINLPSMDVEKLKAEQLLPMEYKKQGGRPSAAAARRLKNEKHEKEKILRKAKEDEERQEKAAANFNRNAGAFDINAGVVLCVLKDEEDWEEPGPVLKKPKQQECKYCQQDHSSRTCDNISVEGLFYGHNFLEEFLKLPKPQSLSEESE